MRRLHLFGITTRGGFTDLPHAAVVMQFGAECGFFHDLARGIDPRPLMPQSPPPILSRSLSRVDPLTDRRQVLARLLALNHQRYEEETRGQGDRVTRSKKGKGKKAGKEQLGLL